MKELEQAAVQLQKWTARRNLLIAKARADGESLRTIASAAGLSHTAVAKILAR